MKFLYAFLFIALAYASEKKEVQLRSELQVGSAIPLMLEDMIESNPVPAELLNIEVPFKEQNVTREEILQWLKQSKIERREIGSYIFKIPDNIRIDTLPEFSRDQISHRTKSRLLKKCPDCEFNIQLTNLPKVSEQKNIIEWRDLPLSGPFMVSVLNKEGQSLGWLSGQIRAERSVVKTARALRIGDTITAEDIKMEKTDISFNKDYYTDSQQILGRKVSRPVSAYTLLTSSDIQRNYDVKQGQNVRVISGNEIFEVTAYAIAQDSGIVGDTIRIRNVSNQKILSGRVLEKGIVRIE